MKIYLQFTFVADCCVHSFIIFLNKNSLDTYLDQALYLALMIHGKQNRTQLAIIDLPSSSEEKCMKNMWMLQILKNNLCFGRVQL